MQGVWPGRPTVIPKDFDTFTLLSADSSLYALPSTTAAAVPHFSRRNAAALLPHNRTNRWNICVLFPWYVRNSLKSLGFLVAGPSTVIAREKPRRTLSWAFIESLWYESAEKMKFVLATIWSNTLRQISPNAGGRFVRDGKVHCHSGYGKYLLDKVQLVEHPLTRNEAVQLS